MTRLLATGDLHIREDRLDDQTVTVAQIVDVARERDVDGVLLAGDIFDRPKPSPAELHLFADFARLLERAAIPTVAVLGNCGHDQVSADQPTALELFSFGDWMRVSRHPEVLPLGDVKVCTLPNTPVSRLVAARGGRDDVNELAVEFLNEQAWKLRTQAGDGPAVLLGHWSISGASLPNGLPTSDLHEPVLPLNAIEALNFNAIVMGHIHKPQLLNTDGRPILYTGSPLCLNFGEADVEHGVWTLYLGETMSTCEFVPLEGRRFVTVDVDLTSMNGYGTGLPDETDLIAAAIAEQFPLTDAVIRIRYRCTEEQARRVDVHALRGFCMEAGAHRVAQIAPEIARATRTRATGVDETLGPRDALVAWCDANDLDEPRRRELSAVTTRYLEVPA